MGSPDVGDVHVNSLLTNVSIGYKPAGFFATKAFPVVPVTKQTDYYATYNKSYWARDLGAPGAAPTGSYAVRRAPGTRARTADYTIDNTNTYSCINYALGMEIPAELRANADSVFNLDQDAITLLTSLLYLRFDREFAADFLTTSKWTTDQSISTKWNDYGASAPIEDLRAAKFTIRQKTLGMVADGGCKLLIGALAWRRLLDHPDIIDRIKYGASAGNPAKVSKDLVAQLLDIDEVIVGESVYTDSEEGTAEASASYSDVYSDAALMFWTPPGPSRLAPSAGYLFNWASMGGGLTFARKGEDTRSRYDWVEVHAYLDWVQTNAGAGVFMSDAVD